MSTNPEKPEKKKRAQTASVKIKVNPKLVLVQDAIRLMDEAQITEMSFEQGEVKIHLRRGAGPAFEGFAPAPAVRVSAPAVAASAAPAAVPAAPVEADNTVTVNAPMVGTFYRASNPESKPFIEEGGKIEVGQVYCIVEAMKMMNEVKSEVKGKVVKILVANGQAVEFGQPLLVVDPS